MRPTEYLVCYHDTDAQGVVHHARYFELAERSRSELLLAFGLSSARIINDFGIVLVVRTCRGRYRRPAKLDDRLTLSTRITEFNAVRSFWETQIMRGDEKLCWIEAEVVARKADSDEVALMDEGLIKMIQPSYSGVA